MTYYLYYRKGGSVVDVRGSLLESSLNNHIEITEEERQCVFDCLNDESKSVKVVNGELIFFKNEIYKRNQIKLERDKLLVELDPYHREKYQVKLNLNSDDLAELDEYWERLLDMLQHYDASDDKQNWSFVIIDTYTSGKNTNTYQLKKPNFMR